MSFLRHHHFGEAFEKDALNDLTRFRIECEDPTFEFLDTDIEGLRATLLAAVQQLRNICAVEIFSTDDREFLEVPHEYKVNDPARWHGAIEQIHTAASQVCDAYDQLLRAGHRKLGVAAG